MYLVCVYGSTITSRSACGICILNTIQILAYLIEMKLIYTHYCDLTMFPIIVHILYRRSALWRLFAVAVCRALM